MRRIYRIAGMNLINRMLLQQKPVAIMFFYTEITEKNKFYFHLRVLCVTGIDRNSFFEIMLFSRHLFYHRMSDREAGDRNPERRTAHIGESGFVAERH